MNNNVQSGSFYNVKDNQLLLTDPGQDAFYIIDHLPCLFYQVRMTSGHRHNEYVCM